MKSFFIKTILFGYLFISLTPLLESQNLYDLNTIQEIKLYFNQPDWNNLLVTAAQSSSEPYTYCKKVVINGVVFDSIGAKYKGNSTFNATRKKNPWHIELDHYKDQSYQGYKDIKLSNIFQDPSCVREALSYGLMQPYASLPQANYAKVWVNDTYIGLYTNVEAITKSFCKKNFTADRDNTFIKCNPPSFFGGGAGGGGGSSNLTYLGVDSSQYFGSYELKSTYGWKDLIELCDTLNNNIAAIENMLDVDKTLWMLAFNILFVNLDSYTGGFTQNYYLWQDESKIFNPIIWDLNMSFGSFSNVGNIQGGGGPGGGFPGGGGQAGSDSLSLATLSPLIHITNTSKPLISKLLSIPRYQKMYLAHLKTMMNEVFKSGLYLKQGETIRKIIDTSVKNDINNLSTYSLFQTNFYYGSTGAIPGGGFPGGGGAGGGAVPGIRSLMENRLKYLDTLALMKLSPPVIKNVLHQTSFQNQSVWINAEVTGHTKNGVFIGTRNKVTDHFKKFEMYDDGKHNDAKANDGIFGIDILRTTPSVEYYIWAENNEAGVFSPVRAEKEFYKIDASVKPTGSVVINELMASNSKTAKDNKDQFDDWIELYNTTDTEINLSGWYLSDNPDKRKKWDFPINAKIPANGYLIVWADEDSSQNTATSLHCNFKLSASGESLFLSAKDTTIVDQVTFRALNSDISYARSPNGSGVFKESTPTFNANNDLSTGVKIKSIDNSVKVYPNPSNIGIINIESNSDSSLKCEIFTVSGFRIFHTLIKNKTIIKTASWPSGIYLVKVGNRTQKLILYEN